jgi:hypothetical protein
MATVFLTTGFAAIVFLVLVSMTASHGFFVVVCSTITGSGFAIKPAAMSFALDDGINTAVHALIF